MKINHAIFYLVIVLTSLAICNCDSRIKDTRDPVYTEQPVDFPDFITPTEKYFDLRISDIPSIDGNSYRLKISGAVNKPTSYSLEELSFLQMVERPLTIECIDNGPGGSLLGTVNWKGFRIYDLLSSLGISERATIVKYICADGYFTYNTLEELQNSEVIGALYMNENPIPPKFGFPIRIIFPGYFGVRQPGWVVEMEVLEAGIEDYWGSSGWKTDVSMDIDSKIFFPAEDAEFTVGENIRIGGAAYGSKRISSVDITVDGGKTWIPAKITRSIDNDYVWVFWEVYYKPAEARRIAIYSRATAEGGKVQPRDDKDLYDGNNSWPSVIISVYPER